MTDITELAQSLKAAAENAIGAHERLAAYPYGEIIDISQQEGEQIDIDITDINEFLEEASPANILALVDALEKAKGSEELQARIAELEESNAQVIQSRDHYKRMTEEGLKQLAEARTVKLPDLRQIVSGDRYVWSDGVYNYSQDVKVVLAAAGIKVEAE
ncbi:TPA: ead/Ea22-like family protein [Klebsiella pneumoniae]|nr:ead/Ea22-like family protein [Klebsiella pneumoniae]HDT7234403.1 ead/Ea22-like family protein [Klebsiella pneumoniae]HDT7240170.1 ead/Ea22-like family protein [Klebsiella pneumoniae]HDT7246550.1 ead/Ea22-like family protein [Klebsiella pneumoniae]HDT7262952.1 ead/Ea22-like family protein [Klebsiella pneumoniae]